MQDETEIPDRNTIRVVQVGIKKALAILGTLTVRFVSVVNAPAVDSYGVDKDSLNKSWFYGIYNGITTVGWSVKVMVRGEGLQGVRVSPL